MPLINACYTLHYGVEWLQWSIRSIYPAVHRIHIFYAEKPSHGRRISERCPDPRAFLMKEALRADYAGKVVWRDGEWLHEGQHRDEALEMALRGVDMAVTVDGDEIWHAPTLERMVEEFLELPDRPRQAGVNFIHHWRSLNYVCEDEMMPIRLHRPDGARKTEYLRLEEPVRHMGYAQRPALVRYKSLIHGHRAEWRPGWFEEKFLGWGPDNGVVDVHPTCEGIWVPVAAKLPLWLLMLLHDHPYWEKEIIE